MPNASISILIEPKDLCSRLSDTNLRIIELCESRDFQDRRVPGSIHIDYSQIIGGAKPASGQVPSTEQLKRLVRRLGLRDGLRIVAYDDEGGGRASRLVCTLYLLGHRCASVLNGGIHAWLHEGRPVTRSDNAKTSSESISVTIDDRILATKEYILYRLDAPDLILLDARAREEYQGLCSCQTGWSHSWCCTPQLAGYDRWGWPTSPENGQRIDCHTLAARYCPRPRDRGVLPDPSSVSP